jgi:FAD/FMN-containing dehydrogenase
MQHNHSYQSAVQWQKAFDPYVNFMPAEEGDRVAAVYGSNYERLVEIKRRYDPENIFHCNQNIKP